MSAPYNALCTTSATHGVRVRDVISTEEQKILSSHQISNGMQKLNEFRSSASDYFLRDNYRTASSPSNGSGLRSVDEPLAVKRESLDTDQLGFARDKMEGTSRSIIRTEVVDSNEGVETLIPGVKNEMILAPPLSPLNGDSNILKTKLSGLLDKGGVVGLFDTADSSQSGSDEDHRNTIFSKNYMERCSKVWSPRKLERRLLHDVLARWISFDTVSGREEQRESCLQGARYIASFLEGLGASVKHVCVSNSDEKRSGIQKLSSYSSIKKKKKSKPTGSNPVVLARFASANPAARTIVLYGHYDVMPADASHWKTDPWTLT